MREGIKHETFTVETRIKMLQKIYNRDRSDCTAGRMFALYIADLG